MNYSWPGNARELKNVIERLIVTNSTGIVDEDEAREAIGLERPEQKKAPREAKSNLISDNQSELIRAVMDEVGGNKTEAAKRLGISRPTLHRKLKQLEES